MDESGKPKRVVDEEDLRRLGVPEELIKPAKYLAEKGAFNFSPQEAEQLTQQTISFCLNELEKVKAQKRLNLLPQFLKKRMPLLIAGLIGIAVILIIPGATKTAKIIGVGTVIACAALALESFIAASRTAPFEGLKKDAPGVFNFTFSLSEDKAQQLQDMVGASYLRSQKELFNNAMTLMAWAQRETKAGRIIASVDEKEKKYREVMLPALENIQTMRLTEDD